FQRIAHDYIEGFLNSNPEYATELGDHRFDDKLTDYSAETRAQELARARQTRQQLEAFNELSQLTGANRVDIRLLRDNVDNEIFDIEELREWEWNPLGYNQSLGNSIYLQVAKDIGPIQEKTAKALEDYKTWLQRDVLPRSDGDFRLGADKFRKKLRFALASDLLMEEIMQRAQADLAQTQKAIYETALPLY